MTNEEKEGNVRETDIKKGMEDKKEIIKEGAITTKMRRMEGKNRKEYG